MRALCTAWAATVRQLAPPKPPLTPANKTVADKLSLLKRGHVIKISGYLVECRQDHWIWRSSTSRNDTGNGACEIIYVEDLKIKKAN